MSKSREGTIKGREEVRISPTFVEVAAGADDVQIDVDGIRLKRKHDLVDVL